MQALGSLDLDFFMKKVDQKLIYRQIKSTALDRSYLQVINGALQKKRPSKYKQALKTKTPKINPA